MYASIHIYMHICKETMSVHVYLYSCMCVPFFILRTYNTDDH